MESPVKSYRNEDYYSIKYIRMLKTLLSTCGLWPGEILGEHVPWIIVFQRYHVIVAILLIVTGGCYYIYDNHKVMDVFEQGKCYITTFFAIVMFVRLVWTRIPFYGQVSKYFLESFHLIHFRHKGGFYEEMFQKTERYCFYLFVYILCTAFTTVIFFNGMSVYFNYKIGVYNGDMQENATVEFSVTFSFPGFDPQDYYWPVTIFNVMMTYSASISICVFDCLKFIMVFQVIGHIQILSNSFETFFRPDKQHTVKFTTKAGECYAVVETYDIEESKIVNKKLQECIEHHKFIVSFAQMLSTCYGPTIALNYLFQLVTCCIMLLECSIGDTQALLRFGSLSLITFGDLVQKSVIFEVLNSVSEKLIDSVYAVPWECMNVGNRRTVCILLQRVQFPIKVTALGMVPVGVTTMVAILKTTFTYFAFLRSFG